MKQNLDAFMRVLDPADNSTGGGTASAVSGAMAAALVAMVARLSQVRQGMETPDYYQAIADEGQWLSSELFARGAEDSQAFEMVMNAYRLPKGSEAEKAARSQAIAKAMLNASEVPLASAEGCRRVLEICARLKGRSNPNAASDLECAEHLARAGLLGCLANVAINLPSLKDQKRKEDIGQRAAELSRFAEC